MCRKALALALSTWLLGGTLFLAQADTSLSFDIEHLKRYGNCTVWNQIDLLTDEESHHLRCREETLTDETSLGFVHWGLSPKRLDVTVGKGAMLHFDKHIPVAIRIDKGAVIRRKGEWSRGNMVAFIPDRDLAMTLMDDLAKGQRVVIQVGSERGNIKLRNAKLRA